MIKIPEDFLYALSQPQADEICDKISESIFVATDNGNFTIQQAVKFIVYVAEMTPPEKVLGWKPKEE